MVLKKSIVLFHYRTVITARYLQYKRIRDGFNNVGTDISCHELSVHLQHQWTWIHHLLLREINLLIFLPGGVTVTQHEADVTAVPTSISRSHHISHIHDTVVSHSPRNMQGCHIVPSAFSTPQYKTKAFQDSVSDPKAEIQLNQTETHKWHRWPRSRSESFNIWQLHCE